jgi:gamma-L-glutamyl-butirosin B gamma-L-glutamyl cyclotransferase
MNLFVYGTLRAGMRNASILRGAKRIAPVAWATGILYDTGEGYPGMVEGAGKVTGEIYQVSQKQLRWIDRLEDYHGPGYPDNLYERIVCDVQTPEGSLKAYTYVYRKREELKEKGIWIPSGDWCQYLGQND